MKTITVGIVTYKDKRLSRLLEALRHQTQKPQSVVVVDADSSSEVRDLIASYKEESFQWIPRSNNLGANRALIVEMAESDLVAFIDSDCIPNKDWLEKMLRALEALPNGSQVSGVGGENVPLCQSGFHRNLHSMRKTFWGHFHSPQMKEIKVTQEVDHLPTANALFRREDLLEIANFSADYPRVCEDVELSYRLRRAGKKLFMIPDAGVTHDLPSLPMRWASRIFRFGEGRIQLAMKYPDQTPWRLWLPAMAMFSGVLFLALCLKWPELLILPVLLFLLLTLLVRKVSSKPFTLASVIILTQVSYGLGQISGLLRAALPKAKAE